LIAAQFCVVIGCGGNGEADSRAAFVTTHWSVVLTAQGRSPAAEEALENLCGDFIDYLLARHQSRVLAIDTMRR
jgi:hypothetical protein